MDAAREALAELLFDRVAADPVLPNEAGELVLAAFDGSTELAQALAGALDDRPIPVRDRPEPTLVPGIHLRSITVAGFRGIGPKAQLNLRPGPGLTIVTGRNGSGKSSFAEAAELTLTGQNKRWSERTSVWQSGWRNLHQPTGTALGVELVVEGAAEPMMVARTWTDSAELDDAVATAQVRRQPRTSLAELGWNQALATYRPFLPYAELGAVTEGRPSDLYEAVQAMLGLELLVDAEKRLTDAKKRLDDQAGVAKKVLPSLKAAVAASPDPRAARVAALVAKRTPDVAAVSAIATGVEASADDGRLDALLALRAPDPAEVTVAAAGLQDGLAAVAAEAGTRAGRSRELARLLRAALAHHERTGDGDCPVCGSGELDEAWRKRTVDEVGQLEAEAAAADAADTQLHQAVRAAHDLIRPVPAVLRIGGSIAGIDVSPALAGWTAWAALTDRRDVDLADALTAAAAELTQAVGPVVAEAARLEREQDRSWQPLAEQILSWVELARSATAAGPTAALVKTACTWLRDIGHALREERLAPFAEQSTAIWEQLRQESNVTLGTIKLEGTATRRRVAVDVTVDGSGVDALGVLSQGELRALGLALFLPRATAQASPFRFVVIDDPVQAMDPAKVDGLARVLASVAATRQVVVFTHDDRLPESVRRLQLGAVVFQVTRREHSEVDVRVVRDPVSRYLDDARAVAYSSELPADVAGVVVASLCRGAVEAACHERVLTRRLGVGERHINVESLLDAAQTTNDLMALALFDDPHRGADVMGRVGSCGQSAVDAYKSVRSGAHRGYSGDLKVLVSESSGLITRLLR